MPLRLSWRISQIRNATSGSTKTAQNMKEGMLISDLLNYYIGILASGAVSCPANSPFKYL
jgi:hypothetical protein